ncbi:ABC transporter permease, partial [Candidatus Saccharibacteria bacterium]|nr:ABC transporter permease [Candidatus Saccharibacteria bacterium]
MNTIIRGVRNAFRNVVRTGSIVVILSISIGLVIAMLAARQAVDTKIEDLKSSVGNTISISPAGFRGFEGGGSALTTEQLKKVKELAHVTGVTSSLSDRLSTDDTTNLESGIELGSLGGRFAPPTSSGSTAAPSTEGSENTDIEQPIMSRGNPMSSITITGVDNVESASIFGGSSVTWTSGQAFDATADDNEAAIGKALAEKNSLSVGDSFTAYGQELTVVGIYDTGTEFANNGVFVSLSTLQRLSDQADSITSATATVDSIDNLSTVTTAITDTLGSDTVDVTNSQETVDSTVAPLESVRTIALYSLIGAVVAGSVIILLTMIMIVRERR